MNPILSKLKYKDSHRPLVVNKPAGLELGATGYDQAITVDRYDFILIFAQNQDTLNNCIAAHLDVASDHCTLWIAYPKTSSSIASDLKRDTGWAALTDKGYRPVSQISIDNTWSALRFKPVEQVKSSVSAKTMTFRAEILGAEDGKGGAWVAIPFDVQQAYGTKGQVKVKATFDGLPYQGSIANMGQGHILIVKKEIRQKTGKEIGDQLTVTLERDISSRVVVVPDALQKVLNQNDTIHEFYNSLSFTNRKEYAQWIADAKRPETMKKRLEETIQRLSNGIKNPFIKI